MYCSEEWKVRERGKGVDAAYEDGQGQEDNQGV